MFELFAAVSDFIKAAESLPAGTPGKEKLSHVTAAYLAYAPIVGISIDLATRLVPLMEALVKRTVAHFNSSGVFKNETATPPAAPDVVVQPEVHAP